MKRGYITVEVEFGRYFVELTGPRAKVWVNEGLPEYEGDIDGIQVKYPDLWTHLIEKSFITEVK